MKYSSFEFVGEQISHKGLAFKLFCPSYVKTIDLTNEKISFCVEKLKIELCNWFT